jgi:hypothetical protein
MAGEGDGGLPIPTLLDPVEEEDTIVFLVHVRILGFVKLLFLIKVVFWRVVLVLFGHPRRLPRPPFRYPCQRPSD